MPRPAHAARCRFMPRHDSRSGHLQPRQQVLFEISAAQSTAMDAPSAQVTLWTSTLTGGNAHELTSAGTDVADPFFVANLFALADGGRGRGARTRSCRQCVNASRLRTGTNHRHRHHHGGYPRSHSEETHQTRTRS